MVKSPLKNSKPIAHPTHQVLLEWVATAKALHTAKAKAQVQVLTHHLPRPTRRLNKQRRSIIVHGSVPANPGTELFVYR